METEKVDLKAGEYITVIKDGQCVIIQVSENVTLTIKRV